jgi:hypothetical protein
LILDREKFIRANKVDPFEYQIFSLFNTAEGHALLMEMRDRAFFEEPGQQEFTAERFAWCDGRKSVIRELLITVEKIRTIIKEENYVGSELELNQPT